MTEYTLEDLKNAYNKFRNYVYYGNDYKTIIKLAEYDKDIDKNLPSLLDKLKKI